MRRDEVVAEARRLIDTPYVHQGRTLGVACDCLGVPILVARALGAGTRIIDEPYGRMPDGIRLRARMRQYLLPLWEREKQEDAPLSFCLPGNIALMTFRVRPMHTAIIADGGEPYSLIHAYSPFKRVVEHRSDATWHSRIVGLYQFRELT